MTKEEIIKKLRDMAKYPTVTLPRDCEALKAAADLLAQPEQEHIIDCPRCGHCCPQTPHRKPLSNQKIIEMYNEPRSDAEMIEFARAIEAAHGIWPENSDCYGPDWTDRDGEYLK